MKQDEGEPMSRAFLAPLLLALAAMPAGAHYNMLLPSTPWAKTGEKVTFTHRWGHPFEHELSDAAVPRRIFVIAPDGKHTDLTGAIETAKVPGVDGKPVRAHRFHFTPEKRGDYTFVLIAPPVFLEDMQETVEDVVKVVLHVQTQKGWDAVSKEPAELVPLTRPYGLLPGMVFQARATGPLGDGKHGPLAGALVEAERYNARPVKEAPEDELITFRAKTDAAGVLTCSLPEPGWWGITVVHHAGSSKVAGKEHPLKQRLTLWVHVSEKK
jgi:cobalt/nickel transport protein